MISELHGFGAVYSPDGTRLTYCAVRATPELTNSAAANRAQAPQRYRPRRQAAFNELVAAAARIVVRNLDTGRESDVPLPGFSKAQLAYGAGGVWFSGKGPGDEAVGSPGAGRSARRAKDVRASGPADRANECDRDGVAVRAARRCRKRGASARGSTHLHHHRDRERTSHNDERLRSRVLRRWQHVDVRQPQRGRIPPHGCFESPTPITSSVVRKGAEPIDAPALSRDGSRIAFQMMTKDDWEIYASTATARRAA